MIESYLDKNKLLKRLKYIYIYYIILILLLLEGIKKSIYVLRSNNLHNNLHCKWFTGVMLNVFQMLSGFPRNIYKCTFSFI